MLSLSVEESMRLSQRIGGSDEEEWEESRPNNQMYHNI